MPRQLAGFDTQRVALRRRAFVRAALAGAGMVVAAASPSAAGVAGDGAAAAAAESDAGAARRSTVASGPPLRVVASFSILADIVQETAGPHAEVTSLVAPDADAHVFQPTPADVQRLARADLVVVNGLGFEGWIARLVAASGYRGPTVLASHGIVARQVGGVADPHAWQSLAHAGAYVENIRAALATSRPAIGPDVAARAARYRERLDALDRDARSRFDRIAPPERRVITSHDAFGYLGAAYGIQFFAPQGWSTDSEVAAGDLARVVRQVRAQHVRALFVENMTDRRLIQSVAREARVAVGGTLYSDALSAPGGAADTYLKLYAHNVASLVNALQAGVALAGGGTAR